MNKKMPNSLIIEDCEVWLRYVIGDIWDERWANAEVIKDGE